MKTLSTIADVREALRPDRGRARVGLVPTMGALHDGHLALFRAAREECDVVVATVFVNPAQFADPADLAGYPRGGERDAELAAAAGVDLLFAPRRRRSSIRRVSRRGSSPEGLRQGSRASTGQATSVVSPPSA